MFYGKNENLVEENLEVAYIFYKFTAPNKGDKVLSMFNIN